VQEGVLDAAAYLSIEQVHLRRQARAVQQHAADAADTHTCSFVEHARANKTSEVRSYGLVDKEDGG